MRLITRSLSGRAFLLQFLEIMAEFGGEIPWLEPLQPIRFSTNGTWFRDQLLRALRQEEERIVPLQFVTSDRPGDFVGGMLHFPVSPEQFRDRENREIQERLTHQGASFISCLQVRDVCRGQGHGRDLLERSLQVLLRSHGRVWGVVSKPSLVTWYASFGFRLCSPRENEDKLWILTLDPT